MARRKKYNKSRRDLFCYGCTFSNDDGGFPGEPTFSIHAIPCHMCIRNPDTNQRVEDGEPLLSTTFPDGSRPVCLPLDCYMPQDMWDQHQHWVDVEVERETLRQVKQDIAELKKEYGLE